MNDEVMPLASFFHWGLGLSRSTRLVYSSLKDNHVAIWLARTVLGWETLGPASVDFVIKLASALYLVEVSYQYCHH